MVDPQALINILTGYIILAGIWIIWTLIKACRYIYRKIRRKKT